MPKKVLSDVSLCRRFACIREVSGLNKRQFAKLLGIDTTVSGDIELGYREPSKEVMLKMASACHVNIHWLLTGEGEMLLSKEQPVTIEKHPIIAGVESLVKDRVKDSVAELESDILSRLAEIEAKLEAKADKVQTREPAPKPSIEYPVETVAEEVSEPEPEYVTVYYGEDVAAGPPLRTQDGSYMGVKVPSRYVKTKPEDYFAYHVKGSSMMDASIHEDDIVLIRRTDMPLHNAIQVVSIDSGLTIKRMVEDEDHGWTLRHEDGTGETVPLGEDNHVLGNFVVVLPHTTMPFDLDEYRASDDADNDE